MGELESILNTRPTQMLYNVLKSAPFTRASLYAETISAYSRFENKAISTHFIYKLEICAK